MKNVIYYFTGSGNSLVVARDLAENINAEIISIPSTLNLESIVVNYDIFGIVFPVYFADFGGIPLIVQDFIKKLENLREKYIFAVCTHAGGPKDTMATLKELFHANGGILSGGFSVHMSKSYSPWTKIKRAVFKIPIDNDSEIKIDMDEQLKLYEEWKAKRDFISDYILNQKAGILEISGESMKSSRSPLLSLSKSVFRKRYVKLANLKNKAKNNRIKYSFEELIRLADNSFESNDYCTGCGTCTKVCPVENIKIINEKPKWFHHCENCYACYFWCPNNAIQGEIVAYNKNYHHPNVKLSDMINQQTISKKEGIIND